MLNSDTNRFKYILQLQKNPKNIRNISIVAHVDHGKTTLSDSLISSNNIFSKQLVGELHYLDSREDEQQRGITMKSSAISLIYRQQQEDFLINLIDSPGHVEFSSEVSSALRLTDGALVVVDALEGVSAQTYTVLKQCYDEKVKSVLVLNKIDKLKYELYQTPEETYQHLQMIIEQVNAVISSFINLEKEKTLTGALEKQKNDDIDSTKIEGNEDDFYKEAEAAYFSPEKGNIVFCSALDCWSFRLSDFADIFAEKLELPKKLLNKVLWGEYYYNPKTKKVTRNPPNDKARPLFESFIIKNIWALYDLVLNQETDKISKFCQTFKLKDLTDSMKINMSKDIKDKKKCVSYLMSQWLPLDRAILACAVEWLPSPVQGQKDRLQVISKKLASQKEVKNCEEYALMKKAIEECDNSEEAPVVAFICKMVAVNKTHFNERNLLSMQEMSNDPQTRYMGFARLYSGLLRRGKTIYIIGPKAHQNKEGPQNHQQSSIFPFTIERLYTMMGPNQEGVKEVFAGNVFSIGGLDDLVFKSATVSSFEFCPSLTPINLGAKGILKVALTTHNLDDNHLLIEGLKKLNKSDPSVEVFTESNGNIILSTCGQVHMERCINDLEKTMSKIKIKVSDPIIQFKETVISKNLKNKREAKSENQKESEDEQEEDFETLQRLAKEKFQKECEDVEIVDIQNEKDEDIRYGLLDEEKEKDKFKYKVEKLIKKKDLTNKGKALAMLSRVNILDIINKKNYICQLIPNGKIMLKVRCVGMKFELAEWLEKNSRKMYKFFFDMSKKREPQEILDFLKDFEDQVNEVINEKKLRDMILNNLVSFGPNRYGPNMLLMNHITKEESLLEKLRKKATQACNGEQNNQNEENGQNADEIIGENEQKDEKIPSITKKLNTFKTWTTIEQLYKVTPEEIQNSIVYGFDTAVSAGPLCMEQMMGVIYILEEILVMEDEKKENENSSPEKERKEENQIASERTLDEKDEIASDSTSNAAQKMVNQPFGPLNGQVISTMKDCCFECFLGAQPRIVEGMYMCYVQTQQENYGKSFEVLNKKRARIIEEELQESSNIFLIKAHLPVSESFDFYNLMQDNTSGRINSQLIFDTWKILEIDPFYVPQTQEEIEEHGATVNVPNFAKDLIEKIRKRKGLSTEEKVVVAAEKQRNLSKKK
ncbi:hypothetical protein ABPG74_002404 [Tetrahymena malaccensis]